ncbi:hypothetical protein CROQUDRAFT_85876 [Cronartium quercuum f. sp. fusiforme G11]|uniref:Uncharacterized protein n=1 Tax=Cronartium quercuum f. sp. fusiforme G11 TaxID=708437 RepID=A0A9P6NXE1_9BASI|nr:hypothetical protein CROQUDRAFT_85876 [Cronartium quercuum f. sp. fusiforme G11]
MKAQNYNFGLCFTFFFLLSRCLSMTTRKLNVAVSGSIVRDRGMKLNQNIRNLIKSKYSIIKSDFIPEKNDWKDNPKTFEPKPELRDKSTRCSSIKSWVRSFFTPDPQEFEFYRGLSDHVLKTSQHEKSKAIRELANSVSSLKLKTEKGLFYHETYFVEGSPYDVFNMLRVILEKDNLDERVWCWAVGIYRILYQYLLGDGLKPMKKSIRYGANHQAEVYLLLTERFDLRPLTYQLWTNSQASLSSHLFIYEAFERGKLYKKINECLKGFPKSYLSKPFIKLYDEFLSASFPFPQDITEFILKHCIDHLNESLLANVELMSVYHILMYFQKLDGKPGPQIFQELFKTKRQATRFQMAEAQNKVEDFLLKKSISQYTRELLQPYTNLETLTLFQITEMNKALEEDQVEKELKNALCSLISECLSCKPTLSLYMSKGNPNFSRLYFREFFSFKSLEVSPEACSKVPQAVNN